MIKEKSTTKKEYYIFKLNTNSLNAFSLILMIFCVLIFYLIYGNNSLYVLAENVTVIMVLYIPYLVLHEQLHSLGYVIYGADFKNITYGVHLDKGVLCCLCKQRIDKRNIIHSLLFPFVIIGIITLIIGILIDYPVLIVLSLVNISGCSGDLTMSYYLSKLKDFEYSEFDDPIAFALYTKQDFSKLKMFGIEYVDKRSKLEINDLRKVVVSKTSIIILIAFYAIVLYYALT